jgi:hypothetical protein
MTTDQVTRTSSVRVSGDDAGQDVRSGGPPVEVVMLFVYIPHLHASDADAYCCQVNASGKKDLATLLVEEEARTGVTGRHAPFAPRQTSAR